MTTSSQTLSRGLPALAGHQAYGSGVLARIRRTVAAARCQLHCHSRHLCVHQNRLFLYCPACRLESPGWSLDRPTPRLRQVGAPDRHHRYGWLTASSALQSRVASGELVIC